MNTKDLPKEWLHNHVWVCEIFSSEYFLEAQYDKKCNFSTNLDSLDYTSYCYVIINFEHLLEVKKLDDAKFIQVENIQHKCIYLEVDVKSYVVQPMYDICMNLSS